MTEINHTIIDIENLILQGETHINGRYLLSGQETLALRTTMEQALASNTATATQREALTLLGEKLAELPIMGWLGGTACKP